MDRYRVTEDPYLEDWDSCLTTFATGNLQQSFEYGEVAKEANPHTNVVRFLAFDENDPVGITQAIYQKRFGIGDTLEVGGIYGNGPVINMCIPKDVLVTLLDVLEGYAIKNRIPEISIFWPDHWGLNDAFRDLNYVFIYEFNVYKVGLKKPVDGLWKSIAHNKRRNIKKAEREGVEVVERTSCEGLDYFYKMVAISGKRAGFAPPPYDRFRSFLNIFSPKDRVRIFFAHWNGKPVAGVFVVMHGDILYALGAGSCKEAWPLRPNDILHWKAMEWGCKRDFAYYHMGYVSEPPPVKGCAMWGLWRWKREWNGELEKIRVYNKVCMPRLRRFFTGPYKKACRFLHKIGL